MITAQGGSVAEMWAPRIAVTAGERRPDTWFGGPIGSSDSPYLSAMGDDAVPHRDGDTIYMYMPQWTDDAGHAGSSLFLNEFAGKVYQDGQLVMTGDDPLWLWGDFPQQQPQLPAGVRDSPGERPFWQRSTHTLTSWTFSSHRPAVGHRGAPASDRRLRPSVVESGDGAARRLCVQRRGADAAGRRRAANHVAARSSCRGTTESRGRRSRRRGAPSAGHCSYRVQNQPSASATLRVIARDAGGRSVRQTIANAYAVS